LLKPEKQNKWYNEFLKLKKNYNEEYLKQKQFENDERKYKDVYMSIPYISMSELNVDDNINKSLMVTQEKVKQRVQPKYNKLTSKEKNKNRKQVNEGPIIKKLLMNEKRGGENKKIELENTLRKVIEEKEKSEKEREKKQHELQSSFKKIKEEKESEKDKLEKELDNSFKKFKEDKDKLEKEKELLKKSRDKEKNDNNIKSDNLQKLQNDFNKQLEKEKNKKKLKKIKYLKRLKINKQ
jgi:hypothetical protein